MTDAHVPRPAAPAEGSVSGIDSRLRGVEGAVSGLDGRLRGVEGAVSGLDARLRAVEAGVVRLETEMKHVATKTDLELHFNRMLRWGLGIMITATGALSAIIFGLTGANGS